MTLVGVWPDRLADEALAGYLPKEGIGPEFTLWPIVAICLNKASLRRGGGTGRNRR